MKRYWLNRNYPQLWDEVYLATDVEQLLNRYDEEKKIVDRVWAALGIATMKEAQGKSIDEIVKQLRQDAVQLAEKAFGVNNDYAYQQELAILAQQMLTTWGGKK